jgi:hypothetical protein
VEERRINVNEREREREREEGASSSNLVTETIMALCY